MQWHSLSRKQAKLFFWWLESEYDAVIADGAIRSGKSICMSTSFVLWAMSNFKNSQFALCGKTIESLRRNVADPLMNSLEGIFTVKNNLSRNYLEISDGNTTNKFFIFGGKDENSYSLIQGITLAGVFFDEVVLMPRSFVEQALARCSLSGSKFWFNCNPDHPSHWFKKEWIDKSDEKKALYLHFTMQDNPSLEEKIKRRYKSLYSGVFYERYILGRWVRAEGRVYPMFDAKRHVIKAAANSSGDYYISIDYGTINPFSAGLWQIDSMKKRAVRVKEYYFNSREKGFQMTDEEYYREVEALAGGLPIRKIVVDPSAASFIECVRRHGRFSVRKAENAVDDGIRIVSNMLSQDMIFFDESCVNSIEEFGAYCWDEKNSDSERVIKQFDHAMDDIRYFCTTILRRTF